MAGVYYGMKPHTHRKWIDQETIHLIIDNVASLHPCINHNKHNTHEVYQGKRLSPVTA
jgi:hypothetical protein